MGLRALISKMEMRIKSFYQVFAGLKSPAVIRSGSTSSPSWAIQRPLLGNQALAVHIPICGDRPGRGPGSGLGNRCDLQRR